MFLVPRRLSLLSNSTRDFMGRMKSGVKDALHPVDLAHANEPRWLEQCSVYIVISSNICLFQLENYLNSGNPPWRYQVKLIKFRLAPLCCALFVNKFNTQWYMFSLPHATSPCIFALWFIAHKAPPSCPFPCTNSLLFPVPPSCLYFLLFCCPTPRCSWAPNFLLSVRDPEQRCNTVTHIQATYSVSS